MFSGFVLQLGERKEPARLDARLIGVFAREVGARALLWILGWIAPNGRRPPEKAGAGDRAPVLLVTDTPAGGLMFLRTFLERRGWTRVWAVSVPKGVDLAGQAAWLSRCVEQLRGGSADGRVDVVAFSVGGLAAAWYVRHLEGAEHVRRLVTIGTPWAGTRSAVFGRTAVARNLLPGSHVLDGLLPLAVPTIGIWSPDDPAVVPASSACPASGPHGHPSLTSVQIDAAGHLEMLLSARVYRAVQDALTAPSQEDDPACC